MARPKKTPMKPAATVPQTESAAEVRKTPTPLPGSQDLRKMIETAAYFRAQNDGFRMNPGLYWAEAEAEILARFKNKGN